MATTKIDAVGYAKLLEGIEKQFPGRDIPRIPTRSSQHGSPRRYVRPRVLLPSYLTNRLQPMCDPCFMTPTSLAPYVTIWAGIDQGKSWNNALRSSRAGRCPVAVQRRRADRPVFFDASRMRARLATPSCRRRPTGSEFARARSFCKKAVPRRACVYATFNLTAAATTRTAPAIGTFRCEAAAHREHHGAVIAIVRVVPIVIRDNDQSAPRKFAMET